MGVTGERPVSRWVAWALVGGLVGVFLGERVLSGTWPGRLIASGLGGGLVVAATARQFLGWRRTHGEIRAVAGFLAAGYLGVALALFGFAISSDDGMRALGVAFEDDGARAAYRTAVQTVSALALACALLPTLVTQWIVLSNRRAAAAADGVETLRVRESAAGGLTVALAGGFLLLAGYVASERDVFADLSYFKTASPGPATQEIVGSLDQPVRVLTFFPEVSAVKDEVLDYFRALGAATGHVEIETHDRLVSPALAREHRVTEDGTILLLRGARTERLVLPTELDRARAQLRRLDEELQRSLLQLAREAPVVYLTLGHGELGDPTADTTAADPPRRITALRELFRVLNVRDAELGLAQGLGTAVPEDAAAVLVLGPQRPFLTEELEALDRYVARGGALLLALDPGTAFRLGPLERRLGVRFVDTPLADDMQHLRRRNNVSDRQLIVSNRFAPHASVATLGRTGVAGGIMFVGAGSLEPLEDAATAPVIVVRSLRSTFRDVDGDFTFDDETERRFSYDLVAAIEHTATPSDTALEEDGVYRAMVLADAALFTDAVVTAVGFNLALVADGLRWLVGEEGFSGEIVSEEDVAIVHTRSEDVAWFYATIIGAPVVVLAAGLVVVTQRRRREERGS